MAKQNPTNIKLCLLGHSSFAEPSFAILKKKFKIVEQKDADCLVVANYGKILSKDELSKPKFGVINIHGSILPKYRGSSPVQTAIANGDKSTGITLIKMDEQVDHGPILAKVKMSIDGADTTELLLQKMGQKSAEIILPTLIKYINFSLKPIIQKHKNATYTKKITKDDATLAPSVNQRKIYNYYRAYHKEPGLFIKIDSRNEIKIISAELIDDKFVPLIVQKTGKKPMSYNEFLNGWRDRAPF